MRALGQRREYVDRATMQDILRYIRNEQTPDEEQREERIHRFRQRRWRHEERHARLRARMFKTIPPDEPEEN